MGDPWWAGFVTGRPLRLFNVQAPLIGVPAIQNQTDDKYDDEERSKTRRMMMRRNWTSDKIAGGREEPYCAHEAAIENSQQMNLMLHC